jgi:hypothetical protein
MKQTAVQKFYETFSFNMSFIQVRELYQQCLQLERQQIDEAFESGRSFTKKIKKEIKRKKNV